MIDILENKIDYEYIDCLEYVENVHLIQMIDILDNYDYQYIDCLE